MNITYDYATDVLYVRRQGARTALSRHGREDDLLWLHLDADGAVIALTIEGIYTLGFDGWREHPDRADIPVDLYGTVLGWLQGTLTHGWPLPPPPDGQGAVVTTRSPAPPESGA